MAPGNALMCGSGSGAGALLVRRKPAGASRVPLGHVRAQSMAQPLVFPQPLCRFSQPAATWLGWQHRALGKCPARAQSPRLTGS
jgi:hypothetical protein